MGMKTALFLILIILAAGYVYYTNPHIIDDLTKKADNFKGESGTSKSSTPTQSPGEKGFSGKGWGGANGSDVYIGKDFGAVRVNSTYVLFLDRNGDGVIDAVYLDTTGDGNYDTRYLDQDYNGKTDEWITIFNGVKSYAWDITGDGIADIYDSNGDGKIDAWDINSDGVIDERDIDGDGNPDLHDYDFDGVFDEFQGGPVLAPPNESVETGTLCAPTKDEAYQRFVAAYNNVTRLQASFGYRDDFNSLNKDFWWVGEWVTLREAYDKVRVENGTLVMPVEETDRSGVVVSRPIKVNKGDIVIVRRRALAHYANEYFQGGLEFYQTNESSLRVTRYDKYWLNSYGGRLFAVGYYHYYYEKPGVSLYVPTKNGFAIYGQNWRNAKNYAVFDPIWDNWFEEEIIYDTGTGKVTYKLNGQKGEVSAAPYKSSYIRIVMHPYGWYTGHYMKVDWIEVEVKPAGASSEELKKAYDAYLKAKACYESFSEENSTTSAVEGELGDIHEAVLSTEGDMALKFSTGKTVAEWSGDWSKADIGVEPWCVDYPALLGHYVDLGKKDIEDLTMSEIPSSGYPESEVGGEIKLGHVYVNRNSDGTYTAFEVISHEKIGDCGHKIVIAYRNIGR